MIIERFDRGQFVPTVMCERCAEPITDARSGIVVWDARAATDAPVRFRHRSICLPVGEFVCWEELSVWLAQVMYNLGTTPDEVATTGRFAAQTYNAEVTP